jgi:glutamyl-tRNA synthetase
LDFDEFFVADEALRYEEKAFNKRLRKGNAAELLGKFRDNLAALDEFTASTTEQALREFVETEAIEIGDVIHALRVAVTGKPVGLGMFEALEILGQESSLARIDRALQQTT